MVVFKNAVVIFCLLVASTFVAAQITKPAAKTGPVVKFKPPKLKTSLGSRSDSLVTVSVDEATNLITLPLTVTDDKKAVYTIASYQCIYKKRGVTEDEESGKVSPMSNIVAQVFKTTPLSEIWKKTITEELKAGEEITFLDVVVKDAQGRLMFAPSIKLIVK